MRGLDFFLDYGHCGDRSSHGQVGALLKNEPDDVRQRRIVAQLAVLIARNVVDLADGREHFGLLDRVDAEVGLEIEIQIQHVFRIAGLLYHQRENAFLDHRAIASDDLRRCRSGCRFLRHHSDCGRCWFDFFLCRCWSCSQVWPFLIHEADHVRQGWIVAQLAVLIARNVVSLTN